MSDYHKAAFTLDPTVEIPDEAAPAIGVELAGTEDHIKELSDEQLAITLSYELAGSEATFTITPVTEDVVRSSEDVAGLTIDWDFGNGRRETGHDLVQRCTYAPGVYEATATVQQVGYSSVDLSATVAVE